METDPTTEDLIAGSPESDQGLPVDWDDLGEIEPYEDATEVDEVAG